MRTSKALALANQFPSTIHYHAKVMPRFVIPSLAASSLVGAADRKPLFNGKDARSVVVYKEISVSK